MELPQGMFGISLATYLLTALSSLAIEKKYPEFRATLRQGVGSLLFVNLIAAILLVILAEPIVRLLFEHGDKFTAASTGARIVRARLPRAGAGRIFHRQCPGARLLRAWRHENADENQHCVPGDELSLAAALVVPLRQGGLGIANTVTSVCNVWLLFYALRKKLGKLEMEPLRKTFLPLAIAGLLAGLLAWSGWQLWESQIGHATIALKIGAVFVPAGIAADWFTGILALALKIPAAKEMTEFALAKLKNR